MFRGWKGKNAFFIKQAPILKSLFFLSKDCAFSHALSHLSRQLLQEIFSLSKTCLTRWVPHDGYIRHQNDHLSGRMTDISVMGEWQVAGVGGTRPLWNVLGEAIEGRFSFEARNYLFSFQSYVRFEEFFCFPRFSKIWRQMFKLWGFWFGRCFGALFENSTPSPGIFANSDYDHK